MASMPRPSERDAPGRHAPARDSSERDAYAREDQGKPGVRISSTVRVIGRSDSRKGNAGEARGSGGEARGSGGNTSRALRGAPASPTSASGRPLKTIAISTTARPRHRPGRVIGHVTYTGEGYVSTSPDEPALEEAQEARSSERVLVERAGGSGSLGGAGSLGGQAGDLGEIAEERSAGRRGTNRRDRAAEANARLTATTGIALLALLFLEGVTVLAITPLFPLHIAIGLAMLPPVALKLGSTIWRFGRYYLGDEGYRKAGPPPPLLRLIGPVLYLSTIVLLVSGVAWWIAGPSTDATLGNLHRVSFVIWIAAIAIHVLGHLGRAVKLARADTAPRERVERRMARQRQVIVLGTVVVGILIGVATRGLLTSWSVWAHFPLHAAHKPLG